MVTSQQWQGVTLQAYPAKPLKPAFMPATGNLALGMLIAFWQDVGRLCSLGQDVGYTVMAEVSSGMVDFLETLQTARR